MEERRNKYLDLPSPHHQRGIKNSQNMPHNLGPIHHGFIGFHELSLCHAKCVSGGHKSHVFPTYNYVYDHLPTIGENTHRSVEAIITTIT
jgi:hypothetical protein